MYNFHTWTENQAQQILDYVLYDNKTVPNIPTVTHLLDKTNFKGMLLGLKTTKLL